MIGRTALMYLGLILGSVILTSSMALAQPPAGQAIAIAQSATAPAEQTALPERVQALEKENVVLREDMGKARLDAKADLEALARRQAEAIARLNQQLAETQAKLEAEQAKRDRQDRNLWIAIGVVAIAWLVGD